MALKLGFLVLLSDVTKWGKCKFCVTFNKINTKTLPSHKSVLIYVFGREEEWSTKTVYGIGAQTVYSTCCVVCQFVLVC